MITNDDFPSQACTTPSYKKQVQSHTVVNVVIESDNMRLYTLYLILTIAVLFLFIPLTSGAQVSVQNSIIKERSNTFLREKRQIEDLENDDFATSSAQQAEEEPGFWDRVVKVALRLFNKFIEWLNAS